MQVTCHKHFGLCPISLICVVAPRPFQGDMNLPPDKLQLLSLYDNDKKWELVCDQVRGLPVPHYSHELRLHHTLGLKSTLSYYSTELKSKYYAYSLSERHTVTGMAKCRKVRR